MIDSPHTSETIAVATADSPHRATEDPVLSVVFGEARISWLLGYERREGVGPMSGRPRSFGDQGMATLGFADPDQRFAFARLKSSSVPAARIRERIE